MTEASLEKQLRFAFQCSKVVWQKAKPDQFAAMMPDKGISIIYLPPDYDDEFTLRTLIHELAHFAVPAQLGAFGVFEEDILERVIEPRMMHYLINSPRKHAWWLARLKEARNAD